MSSRKETETKFPPLLPLEYCSVERAARLLGCEVEDIYHWVTVGAIKLYAQFDKQVIGKIRVLMTEIKGKEHENTEEYLVRVSEKQMALQGEEIKYLASNPLGKAAYFMLKNTLIGMLENSENNFHENSSCLMGVFHSYGSAFWDVKDCSPSDYMFETESVVFGFWEVDFFSDLDGEKLVLWSDEIENTWGDSLKSAEISVDRHLWDGNYYLLRKDLLKIHNATHSRTELETLYNSPDVAKKFDAQGRYAKALFGKFKTSQDTRGIALGIMAKLVAQSKPNKFIRGKRINSSELMKTIEQECARIGIGPLSGEVRKDISQCVEAVEREIENQKK
ncbi:hypothetical protein D515_00632 [Grimontia indica]|uniref:Uncharacterized protein n=1 Tax=Grimontia indica TaxID=1056512 RepID=R1GWE0_9GAMM|nr:hypothetical protein [Grimontia indica]EOD80344.1 hypothetical protein D515_00632 [Grimontia indica]